MRIICFLVVLFLMGCREQWTEEFYPDGTLSTRKPLWKTSVYAHPYLSGGVSIGPVVFRDGVVMGKATGVPAAEGGGRQRPGLVLLDSETGEIRWEWSDYMYPQESLFLVGTYVYDHLMVFHNGPRTYCIDLETGRTQWKKWKKDSVSAATKEIAGIGYRYFYTGRPWYEDSVDYQPHKLYEGNILSPVPEVEVVNPQLPREYFGVTPIPRGATFFRPTVLEGDTVMVVAYQVPTKDAEYNVIKTAFGLYNLHKKEWIYKDRILLEPQPGGVVDWCPVIYEGKMYWNANRDIVCNDLGTGEEIWRKSFPQDFLFTSLIVVENKVIANNEDTWLYAMDINSGAELWKTKSSGTSSHLVYLDGYVYYIGGGDGLLHAVEVSSGKTLWKLSSPDLKEDSRAYFFGGISGVPAKNGKKGRVMANTGRNVYCYEAIQ